MPVDDRRLRRLVESGEFVRIVGGSYARASQWRALTPIDRHYARVIEAVDRTRGPVTVSHFAAAAAWGMDMVGAWSERIDVLVPRTSGGRSSGAFRRHTVQSSDAQTIPWRGHRITTPAQTAWDLARVLSFTDAVVVFDQALWHRRGGALYPAVVLTICDGATFPRWRPHPAMASLVSVAAAGFGSHAGHPWDGYRILGWRQRFR